MSQKSVAFRRALSEIAEGLPEALHFTRYEDGNQILASCGSMENSLQFEVKGPCFNYTDVMQLMTDLLRASFKAASIETSQYLGKPRGREGRSPFIIRVKNTQGKTPDPQHILRMAETLANFEETLGTWYLRQQSLPFDPQRGFTSIVANIVTPLNVINDEVNADRPREPFAYSDIRVGRFTSAQPNPAPALTTQNYCDDLEGLKDDLAHLGIDRDEIRGEFCDGTHLRISLPLRVLKARAQIVPAN